jgi:hypothetical protein
MTSVEIAAMKVVDSPGICAGVRIDAVMVLRPGRWFDAQTEFLRQPRLARRWFTNGEWRGWTAVARRASVTPVQNGVSGDVR